MFICAVILFRFALIAPLDLSFSLLAALSDSGAWRLEPSNLYYTGTRERCCPDLEADFDGKSGKWMEGIERHVGAGRDIGLAVGI
jgi:hypothetical protein